MNKQEEVDKLFRDALHDQESVPSPEVWDKIADRLDETEEQETLPMAAINRPRMVWIKYAAVACLLIGIAIGYFALKDNDIPTEPSLVQQDNTGNHPENSTTDIVAPIADNNEQVQEVLTDSGEITEPEPVVPETAPVLAVQQPKERASGIQQDRQEEAGHQEKIVVVEEDLIELEETTAAEHIEYASIEPYTEVPTVHITTEAQEPTFISVTEAEPIRPMIDLFDEEDSMIAGAVRKTTKTVVNGLLHTVNENITNITGNEVKLRTDDEGSLRINLGNLLSRNKNKKHR